MHYANSIETLKKICAGRSVRIALGNFDGVHLGHRQIISQLVERSADKGECSVVLTFSPHPVEFFGRSQDFRKLNTGLIQTLVLRQLGVFALLELPFDENLASLDGLEFIARFLRPLPLREVYIGEDFRFGQGRADGVDVLRQAGAESGFSVTVVKTVSFDGGIVSSSRLRTLISAEGQMELVTKFLARPYCIEGVVIDGDKVGRTLGFPTANLGAVTQVQPRVGVYAGSLSLVSVDDDTEFELEDLPCVINVGFRPTVTEAPKHTIEAHVYGEAGRDLHLYGRRIFLKFAHRLRDEQRFSNVEELKLQINKDIKSAQNLSRT
jgi:riboflavin kinase/FMN adenylyltransferase